jgi:hypothetical protein
MKGHPADNQKELACWHVSGTSGGKGVGIARNACRKWRHEYNWGCWQQQRRRRRAPGKGNNTIGKRSLESGAHSITEEVPRANKSLITQPAKKDWSHFLLTSR